MLHNMFVLLALLGTVNCHLGDKKCQLGLGGLLHNGNGRQNDYQVQYNTGGWILMSLSNALIQADVAWG